MMISKIEIAKQQLESAIKVFNANDKLAAITLAGASEEILDPTFFQWTSLG
jgi:hypothetical protein